MKGIKPCPYCGGEVEVIRLANDKKTGNKMYRLECWGCRKVVGRGTKFPGENDEDAKMRIRQYETVLDRQIGITENENILQYSV